MSAIGFSIEFIKKLYVLKFRFSNYFDFTNNYFINDITSNHFHLQNDLSTLIIVSGILYYRYIYVIPKIDKKLGDVKEFYRLRRQLNNFVIFFLLLFVKNVGCAF